MLHFFFNNRSIGPSVYRTFGLSDPRSIGPFPLKKGPKDRFKIGLSDPRSKGTFSKIGLSDPRSKGPFSKIGLSDPRSKGPSVYRDSPISLYPGCWTLPHLRCTIPKYLCSLMSISLSAAYNTYIQIYKQATTKNDTNTFTIS